MTTICEVREWPKGVPPCHVLAVVDEPPLMDFVDLMNPNGSVGNIPLAESRLLRVQQVGVWNRHRQFLRAWAYDEKANVLYLHEGGGNYLPSQWEFLGMALHVHLRGQLPGWRWLAV